MLTGSVLTPAVVPLDPASSHCVPLNEPVGVTVYAIASVPLLLESAIVWFAGGGAPCGTEKLSDVGVATSCGVVVTSSVTGMVFVATVAPVDCTAPVIVIEPLQVPATQPVVLMATVIVPSVVPLAGLLTFWNCSQLLPHELVEPVAA